MRRNDRCVKALTELREAKERYQLRALRRALDPTGYIDALYEYRRAARALAQFGNFEILAAEERVDGVAFAARHAQINSAGAERLRKWVENR